MLFACRRLLLQLAGPLASLAVAQQAYCWDACTYNCPAAAPR